MGNLCKPSEPLTLWYSQTRPIMYSKRLIEVDLPLRRISAHKRQSIRTHTRSQTTEKKVSNAIT